MILRMIIPYIASYYVNNKSMFEFGLIMKSCFVPTVEQWAADRQGMGCDPTVFE